MDSLVACPPQKDELIHLITDKLQRFDRKYLQRLSDRLDRDIQVIFWARVERYERELEMSGVDDPS